MWPRITWKPIWAVTFSEIKRKISGSCSISQRSTLVIKGCNIFLEDLSLDGTLVVNSVEDAEVCHEKLIIYNIHGKEVCK